MSVLCICGVCIPYSVLWSIALLFMKQLWDFFNPYKKKIEVENGEQLDEKPNSNAVGVVCNYKPDMNWEKTLAGKNPVIVRFTATWCKPCKSVDPLFVELCQQYGDKATFYNIDVDECEDIAAQNGAVSIPLFISFRNGEEIAKLYGKDESKLRAFVRESVSE
jgi:thioredoxin 1